MKTYLSTIKVGPINVSCVRDKFIPLPIDFTLLPEGSSVLEKQTADNDGKPSTIEYIVTHEVVTNNPEDAPEDFFYLKFFKSIQNMLSITGVSDTKAILTMLEMDDGGDVVESNTTVALFSYDYGFTIGCATTAQVNPTEYTGSPNMTALEAEKLAHDDLEDDDDDYDDFFTDPDDEVDEDEESSHECCHEHYDDDDCKLSDVPVESRLAAATELLLTVLTEVNPSFARNCIRDLYDQSIDTDIPEPDVSEKEK